MVLMVGRELIRQTRIGQMVASGELLIHRVREMVERAEMAQRPAVSRDISHVRETEGWGEIAVHLEGVAVQAVMEVPRPVLP